MKKILHIITGLTTGGAEMMLYKLVSQEHNFDHVVIALNGKGDSLVTSRIQKVGIRIHHMGMKESNNKLKIVWKLIKLIRTESPDIVQSWMYHANLMCSSFYIARIIKAPVLWNVRHSLHDLSTETPSMQKVIKLSAALSSSATRIIYNSYTSQTQHEELGFSPSKSALLPNGFDIDSLQQSATKRDSIRSELQIDSETKLIGMIARYHPMKGHVVLLEALRRLKTQLSKDCHKLKLLLIGPNIDSTNQELLNTISRLELDGEVILLGEVSAISDYYNALDLFVSSSLWGEGFSNVIGEAMAHEIPCIVTDVGDSKQIIGRHGFVVKPGDITDLTEAIARAISMSPEESARLGQQARDRIVAHYSLDSISEKYSGLYKEIIDIR